MLELLNKEYPMAQTIALVDDDRNILTSVSIALEAEGFKVDTYADGDEALRGLTARPVDLAVLDIKMPRMDGMELLGRLRKDSAIPVIFLTSKDDEIDEVIGLRMGADDFITKPFRVRDVLERVRSVIDAAPAREKAPKAGANASGLRYRFGDRTADLTDIALSTGGAVPGTGMTGERHYRQDLTQRRSRII